MVHSNHSIDFVIIYVIYLWTAYKNSLTQVDRVSPLIEKKISFCFFLFRTGLCVVRCDVVGGFVYGNIVLTHLAVLVTKFSDVDHFVLDLQKEIKFALKYEYLSCF